ncbi:hypothetical protein [Streptomyces sp. NHF165]|nr:hypothetical protein [Streptomyces sp. NHF165]
MEKRSCVPADWSWALTDEERDELSRRVREANRRSEDPRGRSHS